MASIKLKGDTSGEVTIQAPAVAGTTTLNLPATSSTLATQNALGVRNLIINGDMRIAQRGTSTSGITADSYYTVDRFYTGGSAAGTWTASQDTDVPTGQGFANSLKMQCTTANTSLSTYSYLAVHQRMEGQNLQHLKFGTSSAESLTVSFWVKSNKTGTYIIQFEDLDNNRARASSYTINTADTWEKKTLTFEGDTGGGFDDDQNASLDIYIWLVAGSGYQSGTLPSTWKAQVSGDRAVGQVNLADSTSNYINITGVQLEVGDTATPFEHRPYDMELARCQRYFQKSWSQGTAVGTAISIDDPNAVQQSWGSSNSGGIAGQAFLLPIVMRATPTLLTYDTNLNQGKVTILYAGANGAVNISYNQISVNDSKFRVRMYSNSAYGIVFAYTLTAEL